MTERPSGQGGDEGLTPLETFVALVAHEVRTPLAIAKTALSMLAQDDGRGDGPPISRERLLAMVERNVDLAMLLMDRMRLARDLESGTVALERQTVDLVALIRESVGDLLAAVLRDHPVELVTVDELLIQADPTAAREIVFNLLSNAAKYSA